MLKDYNEYFAWPNVQIEHFYIYFLFALLIAGYLVYKSKSSYKFEIFCLSFYFLSGNINNLLTLQIPGLTFFEIQPKRFIYLLFAFLIIRKTLFSKNKLTAIRNIKIPAFVYSLFGFVFLLFVSILANSTSVEISEGSKTMLDAFAFIIIIAAIYLMADKPSYEVIGKSFILGGMATSLVSIIQLSMNPYFLRIGEARMAFGNLMRSNGIFTAEYYNAHFLILAMIWVLLTVKNKMLKNSLVILYAFGIFSTFQRMSWIILALVLFTYLILIKKVALQKLLVVGLAMLALVLSLTLVYSKEIMQSSIVEDRLSASIEGRKDYYSMVLENIDKRPIFGFGNYDNEVYYTNMLRITSSRDRATGVAGGVHNGYLAAMFLYGIPTFLCFTLFALLSVLYFLRSLKRHPYMALPLAAGIIFVVGNFTNTFLFLSYLSILYAIHIGIGLGTKYEVNALKKP